MYKFCLCDILVCERSGSLNLYCLKLHKTNFKLFAKSDFGFLKQVFDSNIGKVKNTKSLIKQHLAYLFLIIESSLKTSYFGLKPGKWLIFNCPDLKVGAIDMRDNQGFSHINKIHSAFLDYTHNCPIYQYFFYSMFILPIAVISRKVSVNATIIF